MDKKESKKYKLWVLDVLKEPKNMVGMGDELYEYTQVGLAKILHIPPKNLWYSLKSLLKEGLIERTAIPTKSGGGSVWLYHKPITDDGIFTVLPGQRKKTNRQRKEKERRIIEYRVAWIDGYNRGFHAGVSQFHNMISCLIDIMDPKVVDTVQEYVKDLQEKADRQRAMIRMSDEAARIDGRHHTESPEKS